MFPKLKDIKQIVKSLLRKTPWSDEYFFTKGVGVIHIGANEGQERDLYNEFNLNVLWIEAIPEVFQILLRNIADFPNQNAICALLLDKDDQRVKFNIASNGGASSSIYTFKDHPLLYPEISMIKEEAFNGTTFKTLSNKEHVNFSKYDILVIDVQGAELLVLRGIAELLPKFKYINLEATDFEAYSGARSFEQLDSFITSFGFCLVRKRTMRKKEGVGAYFDLLYKRADSSLA